MTWQDKLVADYARLSLIEAQDLYLDDFLLLLREAVIFNCSKTSEGLDYLEKCWIIEQTKPDREMGRRIASQQRGINEGSD